MSDDDEGTPTRRKIGAAWTAADQSVEQVEFDLSEALATLKEKMNDHLVEACLEEQQRCLDWVKTSLPKKKIIAGIVAGEYAPGTPEAADR